MFGKKYHQLLMAYYNPFEKTNQKSNLQLRLNVDKLSLEKLVNDILPDTLFETDEIGGKNISVTAKKTGKIRIDFENYSIAYKVPLDLEIVKKLVIGDLTATGQIELLFKTEIDISKDWDLKTTTAFLEYNWLDTPRFKAGFMDLSIESIADNLIKKASEDLVQNIDNQLVKNIDLKKIVTGLQKQSNRMLLIPSPEANLFLKFENVRLGPINSNENNEISGLVSAEFFPSLYIGDVNDVAVPEVGKLFFSKEIESGKSSNISMPLFMTFIELEKTVREKVVGESFSSGGNEVVIERMKIYKKYQSLIIDADLSGSFVGNFKFSCEPRFDKISNRIILENPDFDLKTNNFLMRSIGWVFKKTLKNKIQSVVEDYLKNLDQELLALSRKGLKKMKPPSGIDLKIDLNDLKITDVNLVDEGIDFFAEIESDVAVELKPDKIQFPPR